MAVTSGIVTPVSLNAAVVAADSWEMKTASGVKEVFAIGQMPPVDTIPTLVIPDGRVSFTPDATTLETVFDLIKDTAGVLTAFTAICGTNSHTGCKASNLTINAALEDALKASLAWTALAKGTGVAPALPSGLHVFKCIKLVAVGLGTTFLASTIDINIPNGLKAIHSMNATGVRLPVYITEGSQSITFNAKLIDLPSVPADITAEALAKIATVTMAFETNETIPQVLTITMTNCTPSEQSISGSREDIVMHGISYTAESIGWAVV